MQSKRSEIDDKEDVLRIVITDKRIDSEKFIEALKSYVFSRPIILDLQNVTSSTDMLRFEYVYSNIKEVIFPDSGVGYRFDSCRKIEKVRIPKTQTTIGMYQFQSMASLKEIEIPEGSKLYEIDWYSFYRTSSLEKINLPPSCRIIGSDVFKGMKNLKEIDLSNVERIGGSAFEDCELLEKITLSKTIEEFPNVFAGCKNLKEITIQNPKMKISEKALGNCRNLSVINLPEGSDYVIKDGLLMDQNQKTIYFALANNKIDTIRIPDTVIKIAPNAFNSENGIKKITNVPDLAYPQEKTFRGCKSLEYVEFRPEAEHIYDFCFVGCESLQSFVFPKNIKSVGYGQFEGCTKLDNVVLPDRLDYDGYIYSFSRFFINCKSLKTVRLPSDLSQIDSQMFFGSGIEKITLPETVTSIGWCGFKDCTQLTEIKLPSKLTSLSGDAFHGCTAIKNLDLPAGLKTIGENAFKGCTNLETLVIPDSVKEIGSGFVAGSGVKEVYIPVSVKKLRTSMFADSPALKTIRYSGTSEQFKNNYENENDNSENALDIKVVCSDKEFNLLELTKFYTIEDLAALN